MPHQLISADEAAARLSQYDSIIDARSPAEYAEDHLPAALNWPSLDNDERVSVGTQYKQDSAFDAKKRGAALVARRIADHIEAHVLDKPKHWSPLVYCWRGGKRSGTLGWFLGEIGFKVQVLDGGYKAFRELVRRDLDRLPGTFPWVVVAGQTGSGKTRLLHALARQGAQVLDLEGMARHRGSILGAVPDTEQPSQKHFEMQIWQALRGFDPARVVYVESESRKIGARHVPDALLQQLRKQGRVLMLNTDDATRVDMLLQDYAAYLQDVARFASDLQALCDLRGHATVQAWQAMAHAGAWREVFLALMHEHYDPLYQRSIGKNFVQPVERELRLQSLDGFEALARELVRTLG